MALTHVDSSGISELSVCLEEDDRGQSAEHPHIREIT